MEVLKRKISLDELRTKQDGLSYGVFTATSIYLKVNLIQTIDDMGIVTNMPYQRFGNPCIGLTGSLIPTHITCYNGIGEPPSTGQLVAEMNGGAEPYTYEWSNGGDSTSNTITNLPSGIYSVTVTDAEGCQATLFGAISVKEQSDPTLLGLFTNDQYYRITSLQGGYQTISNDGYIVSGQDLNLNNLTMPYNTDTIILCTGQKVTFSTELDYVSYQWSNGSNESSITIDAAGTYSVTVIDANGCEGTSSITLEYITIPPPVLQPNKTPIGGGSGTLEDPYVFCNEQHPVILSLTNPQYYDTWVWNTGSGDQVGIQVNQTSAAAGYGFNDNGYLSSICCPIGTPQFCQPIQTPLVYIRFTNLPSFGCGVIQGGTLPSG